MEITFTKDELYTFIDNMADWYNQMTMYVVTEGFKRIDHMTGHLHNPQETFHRLAKEFQTENPKPNWRNLL